MIGNPMDANDAQRNENESQLDRIESRLRELEVHQERARNTTVMLLREVENKLDALIAALAADDEEEPPARTLDGDVVGGERDQGQPL